MFHRPQIARSIRIFALVLPILTAGPLASAQETYAIKLAVTPGEKWTFDTSSAVKLKGQVSANGQAVQQIDQSMTQRRKGSIEVLSVDGGSPTAVKVTFDDESSNTGAANGRPSPAFVLAGKTVTVKRGEGGAITNDLPDPPDPATLQELNRLLDPDTSIYPKQPVAIGDEWKGDTAALAKQFQLGPDDTVALKCKFLAINEVDGRKVADVSLTGQISKREQGFVDTKTTLGGVSRIDLKTGETLVADIIGKIATSGSRQANGPNGQPVKYDVAADGTLEVHQKVKILSAVANAGGDNAPATAPAPTDRPPAAAGASLFAGSYQGDGMTVELTGDATRYTGTIALGDKKFPVVASADGNKLSGTFESEGAKFKFTALLDGATLTLTSDGTTYTLKKAATNPLARPKAKNPLAD